MMATLDHVTTGHDSAYGYGIINPQRAITAAVPATAAASDPVFAPLDPFIAREKELAALQSACQGRHSAFWPIFWRRRVSKSELILQSSR